MTKIPLETTIAGAYRFLFMRILSILGTLWLPMLVAVALLVGIVWLVIPHEWLMGNFPKLPEGGHGPHDFKAGFTAMMAICGPFLKAIPLLTIVSLVMSSMMMVGLLQLSLGQRKSSYVFFSLGGDVWRLVLASLLIFVLLLLFYAGSIGIAVAASAIAKPLVPHGVWVAATILLAIAAVCFPIYAMVRLFFFLPAVVVTEHRIGLGRSWQLGRGNFWRIIVVILLIVIPVAIVGGMISNMTIMPILASELMRFEDKPTAADVTALFRALPPLIPMFLAIGVLQRVATMGLMAGAMGSAYNALVPKEEETTSA